MKIKTTLLCLIAILVIILVITKENRIKIPNEAIRIRIIANSQDDNDIIKKTQVKEKIEKEIYNQLKNAKSISEAKNIISNNLSNLNIQIEEITDDYSLDFGKNYFPKKVYKGILYEEGIYDSLVITLGEGNGDNWWCILFPPLCLLEDNDTTQDVEYRFFIKDLLQKYK